MAIGNSVNDEIREQKNKIMQERGLKGQISYFLYYYKTHLIIALLIIIAIIYFITAYLNKKDCILQTIYINGFPNIDAQEISDDFAKQITYDPAHEEIYLDTSFYISATNRTQYDDTNEQKIALMATAGDLDSCVTDEAFYHTLADNYFLMDLSSVLTSKQLEKYQDRLIYSTSQETGKQIPTGIKINDFPKIQSTNSYPSSDCYYCIFRLAKHQDMAIQFLEYLETP